MLIPIGHWILLVLRSRRVWDRCICTIKPHGGACAVRASIVTMQGGSCHAYPRGSVALLSRPRRPSILVIMGSLDRLEAADLVTAWQNRHGATW